MTEIMLENVMYKNKEEEVNVSTYFIEDNREK